MLFTTLPITKGPHYIGLQTSIFATQNFLGTSMTYENAWALIHPRLLTQEGIMEFPTGRPVCAYCMRINQVLTVHTYFLVYKEIIFLSQWLLTSAQKWLFLKRPALLGWLGEAMVENYFQLLELGISCWSSKWYDYNSWSSGAFHKAWAVPLGNAIEIFLLWTVFETILPHKCLKLRWP